MVTWLKRTCLCVLLVGVISLNLGVRSAQDTIYTSEGNTYAQYFRSPNEVVVFIFPDGWFKTFTINRENKVHIPSNLKNILNEKGRSLKDVETVIHNHFAYPRFSPEDIQVYCWLKGQGFGGRFGIYITHSKRAIWYKDEEK